MVVSGGDNRFLGWAISSRMKASLATEALSMAYNRERD
jgi:hypothetical protein